MALGLLQYAEDYDGRLPRFNNSAEPHWHELVQPYVKSWQLFRCPSRSNPHVSIYKEHTNYPTYGMPGQDSTTGSRTVIYATNGRHLSTVSQPARTWMIVESRLVGSGNYHLPPYNYGNPQVRFDNRTTTTPEGFANFYDDLHLGGSNVAFVDGHVKWLKSGTGKDWIFTLALQ